MHASEKQFKQPMWGTTTAQKPHCPWGPVWRMYFSPSLSLSLHSELFITSHKNTWRKIQSCTHSMWKYPYSIVFHSSMNVCTIKYYIPGKWSRPLFLLVTCSVLQFHGKGAGSTRCHLDTHLWQTHPDR